MELIDIGFNARDKDDFAAIRARAEIVGVTHIILTGTSLASIRLATKCASDHANVWYTFGIHPHNARAFKPGLMDMMKTQYETDKHCVALGECGLDYDRLFSPRKQQLEVFTEHLKMAHILNAPLFIHLRDNLATPVGAHEDFMRLLAEYPIEPTKVCIHCFTAPELHHLQVYVKRGYRIGLTGFVCQKRGAHIREWLALGEIPLNQLMLESDGPFMQPEGWPKNTPNEPSCLPIILKTVAACLKLPEAVVEATVVATTKTFFPRIK